MLFKASLLTGVLVVGIVILVGGTLKEIIQFIFTGLGLTAYMSLWGLASDLVSCKRWKEKIRSSWLRGLLAFLSVCGAVGSLGLAFVAYLETIKVL